MPILKLQNVSKHFGGLKAVDDVSLTVEPGEMLGLVGPNGSGKTTLFNLISGMLTLTSGQIIFCDEDISKAKTYKRVQKGINRTFQVVKPFASLTVYDNIKVGCLVHMKKQENIHEKIMALAASVGLSDLIHDEARSLPIGNLKKLEIAKALATNPKLILLDEPFGGLSYGEGHEIIQLIKSINQQGLSIIIVEHVMSALVKLVDHVFVLNYGKEIAHGLLKEVMLDRKVVEAYLGEDYAEN
ncbi:MAG: ABC transporter ATP-binding protein [Deltaproteobacteria bacterium]